MQVRRRTVVLISAISLVAGTLCVVYALYPKPTSYTSPQKKSYSRSTEAVASDPTGEKSTASPKRQISVPPRQPATLTIEKIGVSATIQSLGVTNDGDIAAPSDSTKAGWYNASALPGNDGATIIDGHSSATGSNGGVFDNLGTLRGGDAITITRGDGSEVTYTVAHVETVDLGAVDMKRFMQPYDGAQKGLNLITCAGDWIGSGDNRTLTKRVIVYATLQI